MKERIKNKCLTDREIALFIDKRAGSLHYDRVVGHLSSCIECLDKMLEVKKFLQAEKTEMPRDLAERAFRKSALEIGKSMFWKSRRNRLAAASIAVAATLFIVFLTGIYHRFDLRNLNKAVITSNLLNDEKVKDTSFIRRINNHIKYSSDAEKVLSRVHAAKIGVKKQEMMNKPLMYAGYLYFLIMNSDKPDKELVDKVLSVLSRTKLNSKNSRELLKQGWFELFQKEISSLPEKELEQFSEGYILSVLYHSDASGKVSRATIEWGVKLALYASMDEISDCMLYQGSGY